MRFGGRKDSLSIKIVSQYCALLDSYVSVSLASSQLLSFLYINSNSTLDGSIKIDKESRVYRGGREAENIAHHIPASTTNTEGILGIYTCLESKSVPLAGLVHDDAHHPRHLSPPNPFTSRRIPLPYLHSPHSHPPRSTIQHNLQRSIPSHTATIAIRSYIPARRNRSL